MFPGGKRGMKVIGKCQGDTHVGWTQRSLNKGHLCQDRSCSSDEDWLCVFQLFSPSLHTVKVRSLRLNCLTFSPFTLAVLFTNFENDSVGDN